jgi:ribosomal protein S18 acetylase RimI-like enzyme
LEIIPATTADHSVLVVALANAFEADPVVNWVLRKDERRRRGLECLYETALSTYHPLGMVFTTADKHGAALWAPPGKWQLGLLRQILLIPTMVTVGGIGRIGVCAAALGAMDRMHPTAPHLYLYQLGVDPAFQGRGHGAALVRHGLAFADERHLPAYLETGNDKNLGFYRHLGFEVTDTITIGIGAPPLWLMWRDAR